MINPFKSKKGLGRGLSSLIGDSEKIDDKKNVSISHWLEISINLEKNLMNQV